MLATGMMPSALESSIWEQATGVPSILTMTLFEEAISMDTEIAESLIENASKPGEVANAIKTMQKNGVTQEAIKKVVTTLPEESILKIGKLTKKNVPQEFIEKLIDNKVVLENVSDATILAFKESAKSYDDIIRILERHGDKLKPLYETYGDTMVDVVLKYGDEAIAGINNYGDEFLNYYFCYGDDFAKNYFKNSDTVIEVILKYSDDAAAGLKNHGEVFVNFYKKYGDDFAKNYFKDSDTVIEILTKYGDDGAAGLKAHDDTFVDLYVTYGDKFVEDYFKYQDEAVEAYKKYRDEASDLLNGNGTGVTESGNKYNDVSDIKGDVATRTDFDAMNLANIRTYPNGTIVGDLPDGKTINIHPSTTLNGTPSAEIYAPITGKSIKIRY